MGRAFALGLELLGTGMQPMNDQGFMEKVNALLEEAKKQNLTEREKLHVEAVGHYARGYCLILYRQTKHFQYAGIFPPHAAVGSAFSSIIRTTCTRSSSHTTVISTSATQRTSATVLRVLLRSALEIRTIRC